MTDKPLENDENHKSANSKATRNSKYVYGLGAAINKDDAVILGSRLPNCNQVLRCHTWHIQNGVSEHLLKWEAAKLVMAYLKTFHKPSMPMISKKKAQVLKSLKP